MPLRATAPSFDSLPHPKPMRLAHRADGTEPDVNNRIKQGRKVGHSSENRTNSVGNWVTSKDREIILSQLFRCFGKYDPRAIPRIISKRTGITEQAIDFVLQQTCREFAEWSREIRAGLARAEAAAVAVWNRRTA